MAKSKADLASQQCQVRRPAEFRLTGSGGETGDGLPGILDQKGLGAVQGGVANCHQLKVNSGVLWCTGVLGANLNFSDWLHDGEELCQLQLVISNEEFHITLQKSSTQ